jgi:cell division protein FtsN
MGFIVGLLIGLAAALSVAIYVTRVPVPFVDRGVSRNPAEDVVEAQRNKGWNPNAGLGGKEAVVTPGAPAATGASGETPPADDKALSPESPRTAAPSAPIAAPAAPKAATATEPGTSAAKPAAAVAAPKTAPVAPKTSDPSDPLGELARSRMGQTAPAPVASAEASDAELFSYFVQAGAFRSPEDAEAHRAKLAMQGFAANVTEREQSGKTVFRVRLGPYGQKAQADATRDQLATTGVEAAVVRVQR